MHGHQLSWWKISQLNEWLAHGHFPQLAWTTRVHSRLKRARVEGYLAIFVCLATKAVHLEVGDLTTECFLADVRRCSGRRDIPQQLRSDNATTLRGADSALWVMWSSDLRDDYVLRLRDYVITITWLRLRGITITWSSDLVARCCWCPRQFQNPI